MKYWLVLFSVIILLGCQNKANEKQLQVVTEKDNKLEQTQTNETVQPIAIEEKLVVDKTQLTSKNEKVSNKAVLWRNYRDAKAEIKKYESQKNYTQEVKYLLLAAQYANHLERTDIEAWQYNNAGFALIKDFKNKADYYNNMKTLNSLVYKSEIEKNRKEIRKEMNLYSALLIQAKSHLEKAKTLDSTLEKSARTNTIASNMLFINDLYHFLELD